MNACMALNLVGTQSSRVFALRVAGSAAQVFESKTICFWDSSNAHRPVGLMLLMVLNIIHYYCVLSIVTI